MALIRRDPARRRDCAVKKSLASSARVRLGSGAMRSKSEIISLLTDPGVIAVVRAQKQEQVIPISEALIAGGVIAIEITMTTPNAIAAIREASRKFGDRALIGVGTVLDVATCKAAIQAGAEFVVSPICRTELVAAAAARQQK